MSIYEITSNPKVYFYYNFQNIFYHQNETVLTFLLVEDTFDD